VAVIEDLDQCTAIVVIKMKTKRREKSTPQIFYESRNVFSEELSDISTLERNE
jgi:hypothetical protein